MKKISEYIIDSLCRTCVYEMVMRQSRCEDKIRSECGNIFENLFLIRYFNISKLYSRDIDHWKDELTAALRDAGKFTVDNNSQAHRRRMIDRVFREEELTTPDSVFDYIWLKIDKEKDTLYGVHPMSEQWTGETLTSVMNNLDIIKDLINAHDGARIKQFVNSL